MKTWDKKGLLFCPDYNEHSFTHAANPWPIYLYDNTFRIFYSTRDKLSRSSVSYVDIDILTFEIKAKAGILFHYGNPLSFYSHGVSIGNLYQSESLSYILFMGWQLRDNEHWKGEIGRLKLINKSKLELDPKVPFMKLDLEDSVSLSYPFVVFHNGTFKMWYGSTVEWETENGEMLHVIKYATSQDGERWEKHGIAIPYKLGYAQAFSKPSVIIDKEGYHMWFSYRSGTGEKYRIGYAKSSDGINWGDQIIRNILPTSASGWDSEMVCYPSVFDHKNKRYMLYNGNGYGKTGFGIAVLE